MFTWLVKLLKGKPKPTKPAPPKWRLRPDADGTYFLDKWHPDINMYLAERAGVTDELHADRIIETLEREKMYKYDP